MRTPVTHFFRHKIMAESSQILFYCKKAKKSNPTTTRQLEQIHLRIRCDMHDCQKSASSDKPDKSVSK